MGSRATSIPKITGALALCVALVVAWAVVIHRAEAAGSAQAAWQAASTQPSAIATPSPSPSTVDSSPAADISPSPDPAGVVGAALAKTLAAQGRDIGVEVLDRATGLTVAYQATLAFQTASLVKVDILATLLWQDQKAGRQLTATQRDLAEDMITESDNDAATALWNTIGGGSGLAAANRAFGLTGTTPGPGGYWGSTRTTPADQIRLLAMLSGDSETLTAANRAYELNLMAHVESDQRWGVPAAASSATTAVYVKDGWLAAPSDNGHWVVNSAGRIVEPGHDWLVAVLTNHEPEEQPAITLVQNTAIAVVNGLR
jgi:beta-lactamase class A